MPEFRRAFIALIAILAVFTISTLIWAGRQENTQNELEQAREELHWLRVRDGHQVEETTQWALREYNSLMGFYEGEAAENDYFYYYGNLGDGVFPLLRYIADSSLFDYVSPDEADQAISRMERYLEVQPGSDELSEQELLKIKSRVH